mmetsp:Transcript_30215/g.92825  ORF Transcript_30215/g.92825 Transcript_30215/m.92825 type:complete len:266 (-) Transcript_30215:153-950(-)
MPKRCMFSSVTHSPALLPSSLQASSSSPAAAGAAAAPAAGAGCAASAVAGSGAAAGVGAGAGAGGTSGAAAPEGVGSGAGSESSSRGGASPELARDLSTERATAVVSSCGRPGASSPSSPGAASAAGSGRSGATSSAPAAGALAPAPTSPGAAAAAAPAACDAGPLGRLAAPGAQSKALWPWLATRGWGFWRTVPPSSRWRPTVRAISSMSFCERKPRSPVALANCFTKAMSCEAASRTRSSWGSVLSNARALSSRISRMTPPVV